MTVTMSEAKRLPLSERIKWARKRKGFSHDTLAAKVGTSRRHLIRLEKGENSPGPELRARIAIATEQSVDFFQEEDEEEDELARELVGVLRRLMARENGDGVPASLAEEGNT